MGPGSGTTTGQSTAAKDLGPSPWVSSVGLALLAGAWALAGVSMMSDATPPFTPEGAAPPCPEGTDPLKTIYSDEHFVPSTLCAGEGPTFWRGTEHGTLAECPGTRGNQETDVLALVEGDRLEPGVAPVVRHRTELSWTVTECHSGSESGLLDHPGGFVLARPATREGFVWLDRDLERKGQWHPPRDGCGRVSFALEPSGTLVVAWDDGTTQHVVRVRDGRVLARAEVPFPAGTKLGTVRATRSFVCSARYPPVRWLVLGRDFSVRAPSPMLRAFARIGVFPGLLVLLALGVSGLRLVRAWRAGWLLRALRGSEGSPELWIGEASPLGDGTVALRIAQAEPIIVSLAGAERLGFDSAGEVEGPCVLVGDTSRPSAGAYRTGPPVPRSGRPLTVVRGDLAEATQRADALQADAFRSAVVFAWLLSAVPLAIALLLP